MTETTIPYDVPIVYTPSVEERVFKAIETVDIEDLEAQALAVISIAEYLVFPRDVVILPGRALGADLSSNNGLVDFSILSKKVSFLFLRASYLNHATGKMEIDKQLERNILECISYHIPYGLYGVLNCDRDPVMQAQHFANVCTLHDPGPLPCVADIELPTISASAGRKWDKQINQYINTFEKIMAPRAMLIYTAKYWHDTCTNNSHTHRPLWVANYTNRPEPALPTMWQRWVFFQFSGPANDLGDDYGCESDDIDLNYYDGTVEDLYLNFHLDDWHPAPPPPIPPEPNAWRYKVIASTLNIRSGPGTTSPIIGKLAAGDVINALDVTGNTLWAEIGPKRWVCVRLTGSDLAKRIP